MIRLTILCIFCYIVALQCQQMSSLPIEENGRHCTDHLSCGAMRICDPTVKVCRFIQSLDELLLRIPCRPVFKSPCQTNQDCICTTHHLICEENECVIRGAKVNRAYKFLTKRRRALYSM